MTRAEFYTLFRIPIFETPSNTKVSLAVMDSHINLHQREWWMKLKEWRLFIDKYSGILPALPISTSGTNVYQFNGVTKVSSTITLATASGGLTTITDSVHTKLISTDSIGVGDSVVVATVKYPIVSVTETTVVVDDASATLNGSTAAYTIINNVLFPVCYEILGADGKRLHTIRRKGSFDEIGMDYPGTDYRYYTRGDYLYPSPRITATTKMTYAGQPVKFSDDVSGLSNPFMFTDDINNAFVYFLAQKYFESQADADPKYITLNESKWMHKLAASKATDQDA